MRIVSLFISPNQTVTFAVHRGWRELVSRLAMNPNAPGFNFNAGASAAPPHATTRLAAAYHPNLHITTTTTTTSTTLPECLGARAVSQVRSSRAATANREATASLGSRSMWHATRHSPGEECFGRECQASS